MKTFILLSSVFSAGALLPAFCAEFNITVMPGQIALVVAWLAALGVLLIAHVDYRYPLTRKRAGETVRRRPIPSMFPVQQLAIRRPVGDDSVITSLGGIGKKSV